MKFSSLTKNIYKIILYCNILFIFFPYQNSIYLKYPIILAGSFVFLFGLYKKTNLVFFRSFLYFAVYIILTSIFHVNSIKVLLNGIFFISLYFIFQFFLNINKKNLISFIDLFLKACFVISLIFIFNTLYFKNINYEANGASFYWIYYGHSFISSLIIFPLLYSFIYKKHILLKLTFFLVFILSLSKGVFLSLLISLFIFRKKIFPNKKGIFFIVVLLFSFSFVLFNSKSIVGFTKYWRISKARVYYLENAFNKFITTPYLGFGFGNFNTYYIQDKKILSSEYLHNYYAQIITETGLLGVIIFIFFLRDIFLLLKTKTNNILFIIIKVTLSVSILNNLVNIDWNLPVLYLFFWIFLGILRNNKLWNLNIN